MTTLWITIGVVAVVSAALKAAGPALLGGRPLPPGAQAVVALLAPALLTSIVVVQTFTSGEELVLDARAPGVAVAAGAVVLRASPLVAVAAAVVVTALLRAAF